MYSYSNANRGDKAMTTQNEIKAKTYRDIADFISDQAAEIYNGSREEYSKDQVSDLVMTMSIMIESLADAHDNQKGAA